jgi:hypothetical protein
MLRLWEVALPDLLATSAGYSPSLFAYHGALVLLDADVLFTTVKVGDVLDPSSGLKGRSDRYQLFRRLKFSEALPRHLAVATLTTRLADIEGALHTLEEPARFNVVEHR